jgi:glycine oxidase
VLFDTVVVGAGLIGLAIARRLQKAGHSVMLFDQGRAGGEASWAGAGMLAPHGESFPDAYWTGLAHHALAEYPGFVASLNAPIDFRISGAIEFRDGQRLEFPDEAQVNPRDLVAALRPGLGVAENTRVESIETVPNGVSINGIQARTAVVAGGAWSSLLPGLPAAIPVRGHMLAFEMPPGSLPQILRRGHTYLLQRASGLTLAGSTEQHVGFDRSLDPEALADLAARTGELWPELAGRQPADAWCGFRPATPSGVPEVHQLPGSPIWCAYGHFRNGILLADVTAELVVNDIVAALAGQ